MGSLFDSIDISASGLSAQRTRMNVISANIANINTTRTEKGGPYRKKEVVFKAVPSSKFDDILSKSEPVPEKVEVVEIRESKASFKLIYNQSHPDANEQGYVQMPNIQLIEEMVDMLSATRAYEANVAVIGTAKSMINKALEISR